MKDWYSYDLIYVEVRDSRLFFNANIHGMPKMDMINSGSSQINLSGYCIVRGTINGPNINCLLSTQKPNISANRRLRSGRMGAKAKSIRSYAIVGTIGMPT
jgi:hypothetical protein